MHSYTWLQAIRVLAGRDAGHPYIPSTTHPVLEVDPPRLKELLAHGVGTVEGIPHDGDLHVPIPFAAWLRIRIEFQPSYSTEYPLRTVAVVPGQVVPELRASLAWHDLRISAEDVRAIAAEAARFAASIPSGRGEQSSGDSAPSIVLVRTLIAVEDAADQISGLNPASSNDQIRARLRLSIVRGALNVDRDALCAIHEPVASGILIALSDDLAGWCCQRRLAYPTEWGRLSASEDDEVALDQQTAEFVSLWDAAAWIAYEAADPVESHLWAVERELLPKLQSGVLVAIGWKNGAGDYVEIPALAFVDAEVFHMNPAGGEVRSKLDRLGTRWDHVKLRRLDILRSWAPAILERANREYYVAGKTGLPGRPSSFQLIEAEFERRIRDGARWKSKLACCQELVAWLSARYPVEPRPTAKTVQNRLGLRIPISRN